MRGIVVKFQVSKYFLAGEDFLKYHLLGEKSPKLLLFHSSIRVNFAYFQLQLGYSVKLSVYLPVYIFHYFLKNDNILFGNFSITFEGYYSGGPNA